MKIKLIIMCALALGFMACDNQENDFEDFGSTSVYFPYQTPIRTLILGEYDLAFNESDNNGRFEIGVVMSGVYENNADRKVYFELAPELIDPNTLGVDSVNVKVLPSSYYTIEQESPVTIPAGSSNGRIPIQLQDAFFEDPQSFAEFGETHYVIPLRITDYEGLDSLLTGVPRVDNPIKINGVDWEVAPKDYTLFGIKFMNKYDGKYLRRGADMIEGTSKTLTIATGEIETTIIDTASVYSEEYVVDDEVIDVITSGKSKANYTNRVRRGDIPSNGSVTLELDFDDNDNITISNADKDSDIVITGSGNWVKDGDEWGGEDRDVIYLEYEYKDTETFEEVVFGQVVSETTVDMIHRVNDTLVMRDRDVKFEEFIVELK